MKNSIKLILALLIMTGFISCQDEQDLLFSTPEASFEILSPVTGEGVVLAPDTPLNPALSLTWKDADYGTPTEVTYKVEVDKAGNNFAKAETVASTTKTYVTVASSVLNGAALKVGLAPFTQGGLEVRVKASVGTTGSQPTYSNAITYLVKPYTTDLPKIAVPGNHQGWNPPTAPKLASSAFGEQDYEGYVWLDGGHKFVGPDASGNFNWGNPDWGDDGSYAGVLKLTGESDCSATAGYYLIKADTKKLTYSEKQTTWSIIGNGTPGGWGSDTAMSYNATTKKWTVTAVLSDQSAPNDGMKFRANNDWGLNYGDTGADFLLNQDGTNISTTAGTYLITLDLSNPRKYSYSFVKL